MNTCATCHYQQHERCTEPRNAQVAASLAAGGNYEHRVVPPQVQLTGICDFFKKPMRNNYRSTEPETKSAPQEV